jgi:hypothetical protein
VRSLRVYSRWDGISQATFPELLLYNPAFIPVTGLRGADVILLPYAEMFDEYSNERFESLIRADKESAQRVREEHLRLLDDVRASHVPSVLVRHSDFEHSERFERGVSFQTSLRSTTRRETDFALPGFVARDISSAALTSRATAVYDAVPTVGFRGSARPCRPTAESLARDIASLIQRVGIGAHSERVPRGPAGLVQRAAWDEGQLIRSRAIAALRASDQIHTDATVVLRGYIGASPETQASNRLQFFDCLSDNQYSLCVRGRGNFSYRFYESLAMRRIPVLVDTECVLPFDNEIDWDSVIVRVPSSNISSIADSVLEHHSRGGEVIRNTQNQCHQIWSGYLEPASFWARAGMRIVDHL